MVFKPSSKSSLQTAIDAWMGETITSSSTVTGNEYVNSGDTTYGDINAWDVTGAGTDFKSMHLHLSNPLQ